MSYRNIYTEHQRSQIDTIGCVDTVYGTRIHKHNVQGNKQARQGVSCLTTVQYEQKRTKLHASLEVYVLQRNVCTRCRTSCKNTVLRQEFSGKTRRLQLFCLYIMFYEICSHSFDQEIVYKKNSYDNTIDLVIVVCTSMSPLYILLLIVTCLCLRCALQHSTLSGTMR